MSYEAKSNYGVRKNKFTIVYLVVRSDIEFCFSHFSLTLIVSFAKNAKMKTGVAITLHDNRCNK